MGWCFFGVSSMSYPFNSYLLDFVNVTEIAALTAYRSIGMGNADFSDGLAVKGAREALNSIRMRGTVVVGEGERDEAPMLYVGEAVGSDDGPEFDIAIDPLECTTSCAHGKANSMSTLAFGPKGSLMSMPDIYMQKIAVDVPVEYKEIALNNDIDSNLVALARIKGRPVSDLRVVVLNRSRHDQVIKDIRSSGARVILIEDGDIYGIMSVVIGDNDMYVGIGGSPEGVLAAAALRGIGGLMEAKMIVNSGDDSNKLRAMGIEDASRVYRAHDLAGDDVAFVSTGVTDGDLLKGVKDLGDNQYEFHSIVITRDGMRFIERVSKIIPDEV